MTWDVIALGGGEVPAGEEIRISHTFTAGVKADHWFIAASTESGAADTTTEALWVKRAYLQRVVVLNHYPERFREPQVYWTQDYPRGTYTDRQFKREILEGDSLWLVIRNDSSKRQFFSAALFT